MSNPTKWTTKEALTALERLDKARDLTRRLSVAKSRDARPWSDEEIGLLVRLCRILGVDDE